jgi:hypothetical protein
LQSSRFIKFLYGVGCGEISEINLAGSISDCAEIFHVVKLVARSSQVRYWIFHWQMAGSKSGRESVPRMIRAFVCFSQAGIHHAGWPRNYFGQKGLFFGGDDHNVQNFVYFS